MGRLRHMGDWLEHLLAEQTGRSAPAAGLDLALVDGSLICAPGGGGDWRLPAHFEPARGRFTDLVLSDARQAERTDRTRSVPGQTIVQDRGYARVRDFAAVLDGGPTSSPGWAGARCGCSMRPGR